MVSLLVRDETTGPQGESLDGGFRGTGQSPPPGSPLYLVHSPNSTRCIDIKGWLRVSCGHGGIEWKPMRCKHCQGCEVQRRNKVVAQIVAGTRDTRWVSFLTLTSLPGAEWPALMRAFSRFVRELRTWGPLEYAAVKEEGMKNGMKHLHVVVTGPEWLPYKRLSALWMRLTGAWNVDVRRVKTQVAGYVAKYLSKWHGTVRKVVTFSKGFRQPYVKSDAISVVMFSSGPEPRRWAAVLDDGTLVERVCQECQIGVKGVHGGESVGGEGPWQGERAQTTQ